MGQSRILKRSDVPDIRHGRARDGDNPDTGQKSRHQGSYVRSRCSDNSPARLYCGHGSLRHCRIHNERAYGKALPREMVGLLEQEVQHPRTHLPRAHILLGHRFDTFPLSRPSDSRTVLLAAARLRGDNHLRLRACDILS